MEYEKLCRAVEARLHREMHTPADFDYLSEQLLKKTGSSVSSTTLMRLWGYRPSVMVRMSTLDILARFIGYEDYTHFNSAHADGAGDGDPEVPADEDGEEHKETSALFPFRWWLVACAIIIVLAAIVLFLARRSSAGGPRESSFSTSTSLTGDERCEASEGKHFITKLSEVSCYRKYFIHTRRDRRGVLGICGRHLASTYGIALFYRCEEPSPFAIIGHEGAYYLYSVQEDRFVNVLLYLTNEPLRGDFGPKTWCAWDVREEHDCFVIDFKSASRVYTLNVNAGEGMILDVYGTTIGAYDDGNLFTLEDAGPFDPTEAFRMLKNDEWE